MIFMQTSLTCSGSSTDSNLVSHNFPSCRSRRAERRCRRSQFLSFLHLTYQFFVELFLESRCMTSKIKVVDAPHLFYCFLLLIYPLLRYMSYLQCPGRARPAPLSSVQMFRYNSVYPPRLVSDSIFGCIVSLTIILV